MNKVLSDFSGDDFSGDDLINYGQIEIRIKPVVNVVNVNTSTTDMEIDNEEDVTNAD